MSSGAQLFHLLAVL